MSPILKSDELGTFLKSSGITQEKFAEAVNFYSLSTIKKDIHKGHELNWEKQKLYSTTAIELAEKSEKKIDTLSLFDFRMDKDFANVIYNDVVEWINTEDVNILSLYWNNLDSTFQRIDKDATVFLLRCNGLKSPESDLRAELLCFMQNFSSSIGVVQAALPDIQIFLNREQSFKKAQVDYKKSNDCIGGVPNYRKSLIEKFSRLFYEENEPGKGELVYCHLRCVTTMDRLDWDLLIAYTLVRAGDESGEKIKQIEEKIRNLSRQVSQ